MGVDIIITSNNKIPWRSRRVFSRYGLTSSIDHQSYSGRVNENDYDTLFTYCKKHYYKCCIDNEFGKRSTSYRSEFFKNNYPVIGNYYVCVYCGRFVRSDKVTIDHLYPVHKANTNPRYQKKLKKKGYKNVNDIQNLVPACKRCNKRKGTKTGMWIIRGRIGQFWPFWIAYKIVLTSLLVFIGIYLYQNQNSLHNVFSEIINLNFSDVISHIINKLNIQNM